jgi:uncharacterized protein DUF3309
MFSRKFGHTDQAAARSGTFVAFLCGERYDNVERREKLTGENRMGTVLIVLLVLLLIGALPTWPYSSGWGYFPSGGLGLVVLIVLILALTGRL